MLHILVPYTWMAYIYKHISAVAYRHCIRDKEPQSIKYSLDRYLGQNGHVDDERPPVAFIQVRDQATAEAAETAAMRARLDAFDQQFRSGANQSANHSRS